MSETTFPTSSRIPISSSTWFITGVGRGLGRNIAREVLERGGRVAGTVRNLSHAEELKRQFPDQLWITELDLADLANIADTFRRAVEHFGRIHAVVSNAAYSLLGAAEELELSAIRHIVDTNLIGSIELARAAVAHMRPLGGGRLVQISSGAGQAGFAGLS
jgi:NAD(P)-dependent dehydrogenase (short-subunit alcohol dehydrogenase family)